MDYRADKRWCWRTTDGSASASPWTRL